MKYSPKFYSEAFCRAAEEVKGAEAIKKIITNFFKLIQANRDQPKLKSIFKMVEKNIGLRTGSRKILVESARPLGNEYKEIIEGLAKPTDRVERKIDSRLVAGIKVTINDELQFDGSLFTKLTKVLNI